MIGETDAAAEQIVAPSREELTQVYTNPFAAKLRATDDEIKKLEHRRADLVEEVAWATRFNAEEAVDEIARLRSHLEDRAAELARLEAETSELDATYRVVASRTPALARDARLGLKVFRWFSPEHGLAKERLAAHEQELADLHKRLRAAGEERDRVADDVAELTDYLADSEEALARFRSFRPVEASAAIAKIEGDVSLLRKKRDHLKALAADVDRAVEAPLAELRKYRSEIGGHESTIAKLSSEMSLLEGQMAEAERLDKRISSAANGYERAKLHEACERRFGEGSPRAVIRAKRSQVRSLSSRIGDHERQVDRIRRNMAKTTERITKLAAVAARDIDALVIDGNNCCYQNSNFIGLAALIPMTEKLAGRYALTVVFDAGIRGLLGLGDKELRAALPEAEVHVVASRTKADETILDVADEPTAWVVSNDHFGEYREKAPVKERRIIPHEILRGRVLVHDLGVNEPLAVPSGT